MVGGEPKKPPLVRPLQRLRSSLCEVWRTPANKGSAGRWSTAVANVMVGRAGRGCQVLVFKS